MIVKIPKPIELCELCHIYISTLKENKNKPFLLSYFVISLLGQVNTNLWGTQQAVARMNMYYIHCPTHLCGLPFIPFLVTGVHT